MTRQITINLWANTGTTTPGSLQVVSGQVFEVADLMQEVDGTNNLTKIKPADLTCKVGDPTGVIWTFIQSQLALPLDSHGNPQGLLPPWLELYAGTTRLFLGTVDLAYLRNIQRADDYSIELKAVDWSMGLASTYLGAPTALPWTSGTPYTVGQQVLSGSNVYSCVVAGTSTLSGAGPSGIMGGTLWTSSTVYAAGDKIIHSGLCYQCATGGTSGSTGPAGTGTAISDGTVTWAYVGPAIVDGTCTWSYVPPTWQRPVPLSAANLSSVGQLGFSDQYSNLLMGRNPNAIYFLDPCGWVFSGATLQYDYPVFQIYLPGGTVTGICITTSPTCYGGTVTITGLDTVTGGYFYSWVLPTAVSQITLPSVQFPAGTIACNSADGAQYQVDSAGTAWVSVYDTTAVPGSGGESAYWGIVGPPQDPVNAGPVGPGVVHTSTFLDAATNVSPWPPNPTGLYPIPMTGPATIVPGNWSANFALANATSQDVEYWLTTVAIGSTSQTWLDLNSVNGIVVGDSLALVDSNSGGSWTVAGVDPILNRVSTVESVTNVPLGAHIYWATSSQTEMVMEDPRLILSMAVKPYAPDFSLFTAPGTDDPMFGFLPLRGLQEPTGMTGPLYAIGDIEPSAAGTIKLSTGATWINPTTGTAMPSYSWTGSPDTGWVGPTSSAPAQPNADWTCQLLTAPASLMPYELTVGIGGTPGLNPWQRLRNRCYSDAQYRREDNGFIWVVSGGVGHLVNGTYVSSTQTSPGVYTYTYVQAGVTYSSASGSTFGIWTVGGANLASANGQPLVVYDYTQMRRLSFIGGALTTSAWSGSWGTGTAYTWPNSSYVQSAVPMIGLANGVLAYCVTAAIGGTVSPSGWHSATTSADRLELCTVSGGTITQQGAAISLSTYPALIGGSLVTTPYGVYLVGASAIGQITWTGSALGITVLYLTDVVSILFPQTLVARTAGEFLIFGRLDRSSGSISTSTETWMFRILTTLSNSLDGSVAWSEKIQAGSPPLMGCMRDPTKPGRVVGHIGGSLWQVDTARPWCIPRFKPGGMTAMELVEHICQTFNCIAAADANGIMHFVSRVNSTFPVALTVDQVSIESTANWPEFASIVRITATNDDSTYYDSFGQVGGGKLEVDSHPLCYSLSDCAAMAESWRDWFGVPRAISEQQWFYTDPSTAPPWEGVQMFSKVQVNGTSFSHLMSLSQNIAEGTASAKLLQASPGGGITIPGTILQSESLYNLKISLATGGSLTDAEIQIRNLTDPVNHTFATYAKIPSSITSTIATGTVGGVTPLAMAGVYLVNGVVYLSVTNSVISDFSTRHQSISGVTLYQLTGIDGSGFGIFSQVATQSLSIPVGFTYPVLNNGDYGATCDPISYTSGTFNGVVANTVMYAPMGIIQNYTVTAKLFMAPYGPSGLGFASQSPTVSEFQQALIHDGYGNLTQNLGGTFSDSLGNSLTIASSSAGYTTSAVHGIVTGSLIDQTSVNFFNPISFNIFSTYGVAYYTLDTWSAVYCPTSNMPTPTSTALYYLDNFGVQHPLGFPLLNGSDALVGVLGVNQAAVYQIYGTSGNNYSNFYIVLAGALTTHFTTFAQLDADGNLMHIEGPEAVTPTLWRGNVKVMDIVRVAL